MCTLLLKTNKTGCVYFVCLLHVVDIQPVQRVEICAPGKAQDISTLE